MPVAGLQEPAVWPWSEAVHATGLALSQAPASQVSVGVLAFQWFRGHRLVLAGPPRRSAALSQVPAVWHWSAAVHTRGLAPTQAPASQVSVSVQALPSSHGAPLGLARKSVVSGKRVELGGGRIIKTKGEGRGGGRAPAAAPPRPGCAQR